MVRVLIVDDQAENRRSLAELLANAGYKVQDACDVLEAVTRLRALPSDLALVDIAIEHGKDSLRSLRTIKDELPHLPVIVYTERPRIADAVLAIKLGASDYLAFPVDPDKMLLAVRSAVDLRCNHAGTIDLQGHVLKPPYDIVARSPAMCRVLQWVKRIGNTDLRVLLTGETGTGKELVARALHAASDRRARPFIPVNCGAIPTELFEAELFGYRRGAFTGAVNHKPGLVEEAHCGTLFLDEIGELPLALQVRLLRFLESGEVRRLGETKAMRVDVRVIAATNRALRDEVGHGRFRADLYFRLNVARCDIPPLRDRLEDLEALLEFWLPRLTQRLAPGVHSLSPGALSLLRSHSWPGNIRELHNVLEHAVTLASGASISEGEMASALETPLCAGTGTPAPDYITPERERLVEALQKHHWKASRTAAMLGVSRSTLWRRLRRYGISISA